MRLFEIFKKEKPKVVGYCRQSKNKAKNNYDRQVAIILNAVNKDNKTVELFKETLSGTIPVRGRNEIKRLLEYCKAYNVKELYISELDRLGRKADVILNGIAFLRKNEITSIHVVKEGIIINEDFLKEHYRTLKAMAKKCEDDREIILHRLNSGLNAHIEKIRTGELVNNLGRPYGTGKSDMEYKLEHKEVLDLLKSGVSMRKISLITGKSLSTVQRVKKRFSEEF